MGFSVGSTEGLLTPEEVAAAARLMSERGLEPRRARQGALEAADLLALTFVKFHLTHGLIPPVVWVMKTINSVRMRSLVGGCGAAALIDFLLDYASTAFRAPNLAPERLLEYFDWYLSVKEAGAARPCRNGAYGYEATPEKWLRVSNDLRRFQQSALRGAGGLDRRHALEQTWRRRWDKAARQVESWRRKPAA